MTIFWFWKSKIVKNAVPTLLGVANSSQQTAVDVQFVVKCDRFSYFVFFQFGFCSTLCCHYCLHCRLPQNETFLIVRALAACLLSFLLWVAFFLLLSSIHCFFIVLSDKKFNRFNVLSEQSVIITKCIYIICILICCPCRADSFFSLAF